MSYRVYLVEDDENLNLVLTSYLKKEGREVSSILNGQEAKMVIDKAPDLWILDIMLPDIDGYHLLQEIKAASPNVPIIFISARDADIDRVVGLELGSDDYLAKPFLPRELVIRSRNLLERAYSGGGQVHNFFPYIINEGGRTVKTKDGDIDLTSKEFDLVIYFVKNQGLALARDQILTNIWGGEYFGTDRAVDDLVRRVRKKMPDLRLETIYGYGYRMVKP